MTTERFGHNDYVVRRKVFKIFGGAFHIYDPSGQVVFYSKQKAFKLREDIRVYSDETMTEELLLIKARQIIDFAACYDVFDQHDGSKVGALKRKGFSSIIRDKWILMDAGDNEIGVVEEDSVGMAILRRFLKFLPQHYNAKIGEIPVCQYKRRMNPFVHKLDIHFDPNTTAAFDRRLGLAAAILLVAIEGRQQ